MREFYSNIAHFNLDDHSITFTVRETRIDIIPSDIRELYELPEVDAPGYPYKGLGAPTKVAMRNLFAGPQGPKWNPKVYRTPLHVVLLPYRLLAKIMLTNLWPISRHTKLHLERAHFMYTLATGVSIDFPRHIIDIIHRFHVEKELSLPFDGLITKLAMIAKVPLRANEPTMKVVDSISALKVIKSEAVLTNKRPYTIESASFPPEPTIHISSVLE